MEGARIWFALQQKAEVWERWKSAQCGRHRASNSRICLGVYALRNFGCLALHLSQMRRETHARGINVPIKIKKQV
jgi:hypothetical protein